MTDVPDIQLYIIERAAVETTMWGSLRLAPMSLTVLLPQPNKASTQIWSIYVTYPSSGIQVQLFCVRYGSWTLLRRLRRLMRS